MEFSKDCDFELSYHPCKINVVTNALSRNSLHIFALMVKVRDLIEQFIDLSLECELTPTSLKLGTLKVTNNVLEENK